MSDSHGCGPVDLADLLEEEPLTLTEAARLMNVAPVDLLALVPVWHPRRHQIGVVQPRLQTSDDTPSTQAISNALHRGRPR